VLDDINISAFTTAFDIDDSLDVNRVSNVHVWPFELTTNQVVILNSSPTTAFDLGKIDGFNMSNVSSSIVWRGFYLHDKGAGCAIVNGSSVWLGDMIASSASQAVKITCGHMFVTNGYSYSADGGSVHVEVDDATNLKSEFSCTNCRFNLGAAATDAASVYPFQVKQYGVLKIANSQIQGNYDGAGVSTYKYLTASGDSRTSLLNNDITIDPSATVFASTLFDFTSNATATVVGNRFTAKAAATGTLMAFVADLENRVAGNKLGGWNITPPAAVAGTMTGTYQTALYTELVPHNAQSMIGASANPYYFPTDGGVVSQVSGQVIDQVTAGGIGLLLKGKDASEKWGNIGFTVRNDSGTPKDILGAAIVGEATANTAGAEAMDLVFLTKPSGGVSAESLRITPGGLRLATGTEAACSVTTRGWVVRVEGGAGVADTFRICAKDAANNYAWTALY